MWQDRVKQGALNDPDGVRTVFMFEDVAQVLDKKAAAYTYTNAQGRFIENRGIDGRVFPLRVYFSGDDHDLAADAFITSLKKAGNFVLEHPFYETVNVVPFGRITRRDDLVTAGNQSAFQLEFWETLTEQYPAATRATTASLLSGADSASATAAQEFAAVTANASGASLIRAVARVNSFNAEARAVLSATTQAVNTVEAQVQATVSTLAADPTALIFDAVRVAQSPLDLVSSTADQVTGYARLLRSVTGLAPVDRDDFTTTDTYGSIYVLATARAVAQGTYASRAEALTQAARVTSALDEWVNWRDEQHQNLDIVDINATYSETLDVVTQAAAATVAQSFTLPQEIEVTLIRERTIIDLVAELYGTIDDRLDTFINSNDLSGDELRTLPRGRTVVYFS